MEYSMEAIEKPVKEKLLNGNTDSFSKRIIATKRPATIRIFDKRNKFYKPNNLFASNVRIFAREI